MTSVPTALGGLLDSSLLSEVPRARAPRPVRRPAPSSPVDRPVRPGRFDSAWGLHFQPPPGWLCHRVDDAYLMVNDAPGQACLFLTAHDCPDLRSCRRQMGAALPLGPAGALELVGAIEPLGPRLLAGRYAGDFDGQPVSVRLAVALRGGGGGALLFAAVAPECYGDEFVETTDALARSLAFVRPGARRGR